MRRKWYANLRSGSRFCRRIEACCLLCSGRVIEYGRTIPAPYIVSPPYKRKPHPDTLDREVIEGRWCENDCAWWRRDDESL